MIADPAEPQRQPPENEPIEYRVRHRTEYVYSNNVAICQNQLRMQPISGGNIDCRECELFIIPGPTSRDEHFDYFGNRVVTFSIEQIHQSLTVIINSRLIVRPPTIQSSVASPRWESLRNVHGQINRAVPLVDEYRFPSPRIRPSSVFADYTKASFSADAEIVSAALALTQQINHDFKYDTTVTNVATTTEDAFALRAGVCQDFAHVQIACLRSIGLSARYVSGYLRTVPPPGKERLVGADESHAWLEVYAGPEMGWLGLDPTNACLVGTDHIPVCVGRDYDDVSPMRGVVLGGGTNTLKVSVDVEPVSQV